MRRILDRVLFAFCLILVGFLEFFSDKYAVVYPKAGVLVLLGLWIYIIIFALLRGIIKEEQSLIDFAYEVYRYGVWSFLGGVGFCLPKLYIVETEKLDIVLNKWGFVVKRIWSTEEKMRYVEELYKAKGMPMVRYWPSVPRELAEKSGSMLELRQNFEAFLQSEQLYYAYKSVLTIPVLWKPMLFGALVAVVLGVGIINRRG